jgi:D-sedoheptulose 7-phosphate isomerase
MGQDKNSSRDRAQEYLRESAEVTTKVGAQCLDAIVSAAELIAEAFQNGHKLLLCGNGGSAADCQHMAAEFVGVLRKEFPRAGLPAIALTTDTSFLTAFTNDCGFESVFEHQVKALGRARDVLIGISTSGNSANVLRAIRAAKSIGMRTIGLAGERGELTAATDITISVPSSDTQHIQEAHLAIEHIICELVERALFPAD